jgi:hypothetical protein
MPTALGNPHDALANALRQTEGQFEDVYDRARVMHYLLNEQSFDIELFEGGRKRTGRYF